MACKRRKNCDNSYIMIQIRRAVNVKAKHRQRSTGSKTVRKGEKGCCETGKSKRLKPHRGKEGTQNQRVIAHIDVKHKGVKEKKCEIDPCPSRSFRPFLFILIEINFSHSKSPLHMRCSQLETSPMYPRASKSSSLWKQYLPHIQN